MNPAALAVVGIFMGAGTLVCFGWLAVSTAVLLRTNEIQRDTIGLQRETLEAKDEIIRLYECQQKGQCFTIRGTPPGGQYPL